VKVFVARLRESRNSVLSTCKSNYRNRAMVQLLFSGMVIVII
jgi:hypothetical protein